MGGHQQPLLIPDRKPTDVLKFEWLKKKKEKNKLQVEKMDFGLQFSEPSKEQKIISDAPLLQCGDYIMVSYL